MSVFYLSQQEIPSKASSRYFQLKLLVHTVRIIGVIERFLELTVRNLYEKYSIILLITFRL